MPLTLNVHLICNTSDDDIYSNIRANSRLPGKWVQYVEPHDGVAILCGSGPSLADTLDEIRSKVAAGGKVFAMNGAAKFLAEHGIMPDYQVMIDAREATADLIGPAKEHLFASQVHPECFKRMPKARLWHLQVETIDDLLPEYSHGYCLIGGAASVGNTATCLAYAMGYRNLQIYGYDSSHRDGEGHAFHQKMNEGDPCAAVTLNGKDYIASFTMKMQAEKFQDTSKALIEAGTHIEVHGSGLLPDMFNAPPLSETEKYQLMWSQDEYRAFSPGEQCAGKFVEIAKPSTNQLVADLGCGTGRGGQAISKHCLVTLFDFVQNSRDKGIDLPFELADLSKPIHFDADFGYCTDVMEHIPPESVDAVLKNVTDVAPHTFFQISLVDDALGYLIGQPLHLSVHPFQWWHDKLSQYGRITYAEDNHTSAIFYITKER